MQIAFNQLTTDQKNFYSCVLQTARPTATALTKLTKEVLLTHQIKVLPDMGNLNRWRPCFRVKLLSVARQGTIAQYRADFLQYRVYVKLLNLTATKKQ